MIDQYLLAYVAVGCLFVAAVGVLMCLEIVVRVWLAVRRQEFDYQAVLTNDDFVFRARRRVNRVNSWDEKVDPRQTVISANVRVRNVADATVPPAAPESDVIPDIASLQRTVEAYGKEIAEYDPAFPELVLTPPPNA